MWGFSDLVLFAKWARTHIAMAVLLVAGLAGVAAGYAFISGYATTYGESLVGQYSKFKQSVQSYSVIDGLLSTYLQKYNASRVMVGRFHDSVHDVNNNPLFFVAFVDEVTQPGVAIDTTNNVSASIYSPVLGRLVDSESSFYMMMSALPYGAMRQQMEQYGNKSAFFVPIPDLRGRIIGMLILTWIDANDLPTAEQIADMGKTLPDVAAKIGAFFSAQGD